MQKLPVQVQRGAEGSVVRGRRQNQAFKQLMYKAAASSAASILPAIHRRVNMPTPYLGSVWRFTVKPLAL